MLAGLKKSDSVEFEDTREF